VICGECGSAVVPPRLRARAEPASETGDTRVIEPIDRRSARPTASVPRIRSIDLPSGEPDAPPAPGPVDSSFALRLTFSTGESVVVRGGGLIGRLPVAAEGESPGQLISIADAGRTVSKTHLEFGVSGHRLWVSDRHSGNGTIIRAADGSARVCRPGRRVIVDAGSRVEMGDQSFTVELALGAS
jgi:hypothetical protein